MELELFYLKNLKKLFLSKFVTHSFLREFPTSFVTFWLLFKNIKKNNVLGFVIAVLIADGQFPYLLRKRSRKQVYLLGVKVVLNGFYFNFLQKFRLLYCTGLEDIKQLDLAPRGSHNMVILKKDFPYASELDVFLDSIMREVKSNVFNLLLTVNGFTFWYFNEVLVRSIGLPTMVKRSLLKNFRGDSLVVKW